MASQPHKESPLGSGHVANPIRLKPTIAPFAGRIGGNQALVLDPNDPDNKALLRKVPDAAPYFNLADGFSPTGFADIEVWKYAMLECFGTMMVVFSTAWISVHPPSTTSSTTTTLGPSGVYGTTAFLAPLIGGIGNWFTITLFVYAFSSTSGAHLNPTITLGTFFARIISFPRLVLYVAAQILGGTLAGLIIKRAYGTSNFQVGGCTVNTSQVPVGDALVLEFVYSLMLIFLAFGVGLDPRQSQVIGSALSPWLVGLVLGFLSFGSGFTRTGYEGASLNPARCFGAYVGSSFPSYHWIHWAGPILASIGHGVVYFIVPPWQIKPSSRRDSINA